MAFIYKITNTINGKAYIGKTKGTVEKRWKEHCQDKTKDHCKNRPLYRALNKYGIEAFTVDTLEETADAETREIFWIEFYGTYKLGYNATKGGEGVSRIDIEHVKELYLKIGTVTGVALITRHKQSYLATVLRQAGVTIISSAEHSKNRCQNRVLCVETGVVFESQMAAARFLRPDFTRKQQNSIATKISHCCKGIRKVAYTYTWIYV